MRACKFVKCPKCGNEYDMYADECRNGCDMCSKEDTIRVRDLIKDYVVSLEGEPFFKDALESFLNLEIPASKIKSMVSVDEEKLLKLLSNFVFRDTAVNYISPIVCHKLTETITASLSDIIVIRSGE